MKNLKFKIFHYDDEGNKLYVQNKLEQEIKTFIIEIYIYDNQLKTETLIPVSDWGNLSVLSMDDNVVIRMNPLVINCIALKIGTGILKAYYKIGTETLIGDFEVIIYEPWFRENYWRMIGTADKNEIGTGTYADCLLKACFEMIDILWAYYEETLTITHPLFSKSKFVNSIGRSKGFLNVDFKFENTNLEYFALNLYRELLNNLYELLLVRGTRLSYEMFFGALGYDIELQEFWTNGDGELIEINPLDESKSTFVTYSTTGEQLTSTIDTDPRYMQKDSVNVQTWNKSVYLKPILSAKTQYENVAINTGYSAEQQSIIWNYLEYLRPLHIRYLNEEIKIIIIPPPGPGPDPGPDPPDPDPDDPNRDLTNDPELPPGIQEKINRILPLDYDPLDDDWFCLSWTQLLLPINNTDVNPRYYNRVNNQDNPLVIDYNYNSVGLLVNKDVDNFIGWTNGEINLANNTSSPNLQFIYNFIPNYSMQLYPTGTIPKYLYLTMNFSSDTDLSNNIEYEVTMGSNTYTGSLSSNTIIIPQTEINGTWNYFFEDYNIILKVTNTSGTSAHIELESVTGTFIYNRIDSSLNTLVIDAGGMDIPEGKGSSHIGLLPIHPDTWTWTGGGFAVEHAWRTKRNESDPSNNQHWRESFVNSDSIGADFGLWETIVTYPKYDIPGNQYDIGLKYDYGNTLVEEPLPS